MHNVTNLYTLFIKWRIFFLCINYSSELNRPIQKTCCPRNLQNLLEVEVVRIVYVIRITEDKLFFIYTCAVCTMHNCTCNVLYICTHVLRSILMPMLITRVAQSTFNEKRVYIWVRFVSERICLRQKLEPLLQSPNGRKTTIIHLAG